MWLELFPEHDRLGLEFVRLALGLFERAITNALVSPFHSHTVLDKFGLSRGGDVLLLACRLCTVIESTKIESCVPPHFIMEGTA